MLQNASLVGEKIVKAAQSYVKTKLTEAVREATEHMPPEVLEEKGRMYEFLLEMEDVQTWTKAQKHMEVCCYYVYNACAKSFLFCL